MAKFIGRSDELELLNRLAKKSSASLIVVKGRRRIGKSRLLEEFGRSIARTYTFSGLPPTKNPEEITPQFQRNEFARQLYRQTGSDILMKEDWSDIFFHLSNITSSEPVLIILDEISWMGSKDPTFLGKLKNAWDLYFRKNDRLILAICGSASAWIDKNILSSTGFLGRESLSLTLEELPLPDCTKFWHSEELKISTHEKLKVLSVTGGIPRYLEHIDIHLSAEDNIRQLCFTNHGILYNEFDKIFSDLFSSQNILYKRIVDSLANGIADLQTISERINLQRGGDISEYLDNLIKSGFVSRDYTWKIKEGEVSKLSHYRLKDNYSRFYLNYIMPNRSKIDLGNLSNISLSTLRGWNSIMGLQVENLVLSNRQLIKKALRIDPNDIVCDNPYFQRTTSRQEGCQIDYLIQTKQNTLYLCEIKFSKHEVGPHVINETQEKVRKLKIPKNFSLRTVLIHTNGVSAGLEDSQYFSNIIDLSDFIAGTDE